MKKFSACLSWVLCTVNSSWAQRCNFFGMLVVIIFQHWEEKYWLFFWLTEIARTIQFVGVLVLFLDALRFHRKFKHYLNTTKRAVDALDRLKNKPALASANYIESAIEQAEAAIAEQNLAADAMERRYPSPTLK